MSWGPPLYAQVPEEAMPDLVLQLNIDVLPDGSLSTGNANFALAPMDPPWVTPPVIDTETGDVLIPGERMTGTWFMGRLNDEWAGAEAALAVLQAANVLHDLVDPPMVWS